MAQLARTGGSVIQDRWFSGPKVQLNRIQKTAYRIQLYKINRTVGLITLLTETLLGNIREPGTHLDRN